MVPMTVLRGVSLAALMSFFGTLVFAARLELPDSDQAARLRRVLQRSGWVSGVLAIIVGAGWFVLVARSITGATSLNETLSALLPVTLDTQFGPWLLVRLGLVVAAVLLGGRWRALGLVLAAAALALQPLLAHAGAIGGGIGWLLIGSEALHMLAAGAWLGGLLPLAVAVVTLPAPAAAGVCRRFSTLALGAVLLLLASGFIQAEVLLGGTQALAVTPYGHVLALKLGLIALALVLAAINRFELARCLVASIRARRWLPRAVRTEAAVGLGIVLVAGWLGTLAPTADPHAAWSPSRLAAAVAAAIVAVIALAVAAQPGGEWRIASGPRRSPPAQS